MSARYSKEFIDYVNDLSIRDEYFNTFGTTLPTGKFFCLWHHNVNTPAAKVYGNHIKCFSCNRNYTTFDLLRDFNPDRLEHLSRTVLLNVRTPVSRTPLVIKYPIVSELDISHGVTLELLDKIANYGEEKGG